MPSILFVGTLEAIKFFLEIYLVSGMSLYVLLNSSAFKERMKPC